MGYHMAALWAGFLLDKLLGDPLWFPHPVVAFGKAIVFFDRKLNGGKYRLAKGVAVAVSLVAATFAFFFLLMLFAYRISPLFAAVIEAVFVFFGFGRNNLGERRKSCFFRCWGKGLEEGRKQVGRIVGRDTQSLSKNEIQCGPRSKRWPKTSAMA